MPVSLFASNFNSCGDRLQKVIESVVPPGMVRRYRNAEAFIDVLRRPSNGVTAAVALAATIEELEDIGPIGALTDKLRIILVLPDDKPETTAKAHTLRPRYISYQDGDFKDVAAVLVHLLYRSKD